MLCYVDLPIRLRGKNRRKPFITLAPCRSCPIAAVSGLIARKSDERMGLGNFGLHQLLREFVLS